MSFSSPPNHFRHHHKRDEVQDYRVQYPYHPRNQHHDMDERRKYPVQRADSTDATLYDNYPYHANRLLNDDQYGNTDRPEPRKFRATEYEVYDYVRVPGVKDDVGGKFVDEDVNEEAEEFIQMEHKKFNMIKWFSK